MRKTTILLIIISFLIPYSESMADISSNLLAHYNFDGNTIDSSGNSNNAIATNATYLPGKCGQSINFTADKGVVVTPIVNLQGPFTISAWIFTDRYTRQIIFENRKADLSTERDFYLELLANGKITIIADGLGIIEGGGPYSLNTWFHVTAIVDATRGVSLYYNGQLVGSNKSGSNLNFNSGYNYYIGERPNDPNYPLGPFHGRIDDFRIYSRQLSASDIQDLVSQCGDSGSTSKIEVLNIHQNDDTLNPILTINGRFYRNGMPASFERIGADDPISNTCNDNFVTTDVLGNFVHTWNLDHVKEGIYQLLLYSGNIKTQVSIPISNLYSKKYYQFNSLQLDIGPLYNAGVYRGYTQYYSTITGCKIEEPTPEEMREELRNVGKFMMDWIANTTSKVAGNPVNLIAAVGVLTCFVPSAITQATTCPAAVTFLSASTTSSAAWSGIRLFSDRLIDKSNLTNAQKQESKKYLALSETAYSIATGNPGKGIENALEVTSNSFDAANTLHYVYINETYSSQNTKRLDGIFMISENSNGTILVVAAATPKKRNISPWINLLLH